MSSALLSHLNIKIPSLAIINEINPNVAVKSDTLSPPAKSAGSGLPIASTESKAIIKPITEPKNPNTKPSKLESVVKRMYFFESCSFFFKLMKLITIKNTDNTKHINIIDINKGPPSLNRSANCEKNDGLFKNKETKNVLIIDGFN